MRFVLEPQTLGDTLAETAGYKSGLALSIEEMCDHLVEGGYSDLIVESEKQVITIRSEEYEDLFYELLYRIGHTEKKFDGDVTGIKLYHKYKGTPEEKIYFDVLKAYSDMTPLMIKVAKKKGTNVLDPTPMIDLMVKQHGIDGLEILREQIEAINNGLYLKPTSGLRYTEWSGTEQLSNLFDGDAGELKHGKFIDQRFIDYLQVNKEKLSDVHWRKFEELTAEYFHNQGYQVELGPGRNDDGVDVRAWKPEQARATESPHIIIQCKRQKKKIEKVVIKGLYADVIFQEADYGLIVTSSELSPGARETISTRSYPIQEINNRKIGDWLNVLRTPGTGIVRI